VLNIDKQIIFVLYIQGDRNFGQKRLSGASLHTKFMSNRKNLKEDLIRQVE
jgi:hypothetical protein